MLEDEAGSNIVDHQAKADLISIAFKERLGVSSFTDINLDLGLFFQTHVESAVLTEPFSTDEIDTVVKSLPSDKAPIASRQLHLIYVFVVSVSVGKFIVAHPHKR